MADDIFDKITKSGGDIFDKVAANQPSTPNLQTGQGMEQQAVQQSRQQIAAPVIQAAQEHEARQERLGYLENRALHSPTPLTNASMLYAPITAAKSLIGAKIGGAAGGALAPKVSSSPEAEQYGQLIGGTIGGAAGASTSLPNVRSIVAKSFTPAGDLNPNSWWNLLRPSTAIETLARKIGGVSKQVPGVVSPEQAEFMQTKQVTEAHEAAIAQAEKMAKVQRVEEARAIKQAQQARDEALAARDQHAEDLMNRQREQDRLDAASAKAANAAARSQREALEARDQKAEDLMNRQRQQDALDKDAAQAQQQAETARNQHAQDLMNRQKQQDLLDAKHAKALKDLEGVRQRQLADNERLIQQHAEALNRRGPSGPLASQSATQPAAPPPGGTSSQDLLTRTKTIVRPGELPSAADLKRAGDFTQVPFAKLKVLANMGDELAKNELTRRLKIQ